ncbi:acryloyl-CoA reductase [Rhizobium sp. SG741]|uniref:acrylyl-CoA reductase family protein n=1 Tax=Rhizobium sp. SG741 TaxID=2587114 RepID=UPI0017FBC44F|nr:acryloyl-CoA reductase [Rhizobium sp. SG741]NKJ03781.1 acrylyl-CoA reductase (NADPH) [Rhizobium sp. SG741]
MDHDNGRMPHDTTSSGTLASFEALVLRKPGDAIESRVETLSEVDLLEGDVLVKVAFSDLGYKDGLAITGSGHRQLVSTFPFVPGVDLAGTVEKSSAPAFQPGDQVILTGWGVGERHWGGYAQKARVRSEWLVRLPGGMSLRQSMIYGSAGLSAMLCVNALERYGISKERSVLVTGASGGVGSIAVALLHRLGYRVTASTSRPNDAEYLVSLGADEIVDANDFKTAPDKPLLPERWAGAIDNVGGTTLAHVLASISYGGAIASLGLVGGSTLETTVLPFIKRGVAVLGVDSEICPTELRNAAWSRLVEVLPDGVPEVAVHEVGLQDLSDRARAILRGETKGRTIVVLWR